MVEILLVLVEGADDHRHVVASVVLLRVGVHNPFVARGSDGYVTSCAHIVNAERHSVECCFIVQRCYNNG